MTLKEEFKMHRTLSGKLISIVLVITAFIGMLIPSFNTMNSSAAEDYRLWRQKDSRWASVHLGSSSETMSSAGCLVTSIAILAVHSGSKSADDFTPLVLVNSLNSVGAFNSSGSIANWNSINKVIPDVKFVDKYSFTSTTQSGKAKEMKELTDKGYYLICFTGRHWVFIDSIVGNDVYMIDPAKDDTKLFESYNNANITQLRIFTGKKSPVNTTAPTTAQPTTKKTVKLGEYYNSQENDVPIYSDAKASSVIASLEYGQLVDVIKTDGKFGVVQLGAEKGWIEMSKLSYTGDSDAHKTGDINGDGSVDQLDLSLLSEYLLSVAELPDGISILRKCELDAADLNADGTVDHNDVLTYLSELCD